jgi:hypothetical protein
VAEKLNGPGFGFRMQAAGQQVSTADVARQVITRMSEAAIIRDHQLHELLADCERWAEGDSGPEGGVYSYVAGRLKTILGKQ